MAIVLDINAMLTYTDCRQLNMFDNELEQSYEAVNHIACKAKKANGAHGGGQSLDPSTSDSILSDQVSFK